MSLLIILIALGFSLFCLTLAAANFLEQPITRWINKKIEVYRNMLSLAWIDKTPEHFLKMQFIYAILGLVISYLWLGNFILSIMAAVALFLYVEKNLDKKIKNRRETFNLQMVDALSVLAGSIKSGQTISQAIQTLVTHMPAPISQEFGIAVTARNMGEDLAQSLKYISNRMISQNLDLTVSSILIAESAGGNLIETFERIAASVRQIYQLEVKIKTASSQERMQGKILGFLPLVMMAILFFMQPDMVTPLFTHIVGYFILALIIIFEIIGMFLTHYFLSRPI